VIANEQIEQNRPANDGNPCYLDIKADAPFFQVPHHPRRRIQAKRTAPRQHDRMSLVHQGDGIEQVGLARPGGPAPHIDPGRCPILADNHGTARSRLQIVRMSNPYVLYVGESYLPHDHHFLSFSQCTSASIKLCKSLFLFEPLAKLRKIVTPAKAEVQKAVQILDSGFSRNDDKGLLQEALFLEKNHTPVEEFEKLSGSETCSLILNCRRFSRVLISSFPTL
jgi:hypothetical protein